MLETALYVLSSFWFGALHAATPGHGKTAAAAYLVGARGRMVDAITLGIIVTLAHTIGVLVFGLVAVFGSAALLPRVVEQYVAFGTALLIFAIGVGMLWSQRTWLADRLRAVPLGRPVLAVADAVGVEQRHTGHAHLHGDEPLHGARHHHHDHDTASKLARHPPSFGLLVALGVAGGVMPDPGAMAVLLAALANGRLVLGLLTVLVFSLGFASVLVAVGALVGRAGGLLLERLSNSVWLGWLRVGSAAVITVYGLVTMALALRNGASLL